MGRPAKRKIIVFAKPREVEIHSSILPATDADSVLTKTSHTSISRGTELNLYHGRTRDIRGIWYAWYPLVPGYEAVGRVVETGANVTHVKPGDRVLGAGESGGDFAGYCNAWGGQTEYGLYNAAPAPGSDVAEPVKIPDSVSDEEALMAVLAAVPLNGIREKLSFVGPGTTVLVLGQGGMGLAACQYHKQLGARVIVADAIEERADIARQAGWAESLCGRDVELQDRVEELTDGGPDVVHDTTGSLECLSAALEMVKSGGTVLGTGLYLQSMRIDLCNTMWTKSITFACCVGSSPALRAEVLDMISQGTFNAKSMIYDTFDFQQADEIFRLTDEEPHRIIKPIIRWSAD